MKFVEAEQPALLGDVVGGEPDRVLAFDPAVLQLLAIGPHPLVHVSHEFMEVGAALADHRVRLEEQIHHHGLAAADVAVDVKAFHRLNLAAVA